MFWIARGYKQLLFIFGIFLITSGSVCSVSAASWLNTTLDYDGSLHPYKVEAVDLYVNGVYMNDLSMPPIILESTTLVPAREVFEALGALVEWKPETNQVMILYDAKIVILTINELSANVNGAQMPLTVPAKIINGKTMLPVRFTSEAFGLNVGWENATRVIDISEGQAQASAAPAPTDGPTAQPPASYGVTQISSILVPDCNLDPYFYINAESAISSYTENTSATDNTFTVDITNALPTLKTSSYTLPMNNFVNFITAETKEVNGTYTTKVRFELALNTSAKATLSDDRKKITLFFKNTKSPGGSSATEAKQFNANFWYDITNKEIVINKSCGIHMDTTAIVHTDDYANKAYTIAFAEDDQKFFPDGTYTIDDPYITSVEASTKNGKTQFLIHEKTINLFEIDEDANYIYIRRISPKDVYDKIVVIDPGHGGNDVGTSENGLIEKEVTLDVCNRLIQLLEKDGRIKVYATRTTDVYVTRPDRAAFGNEVGDLFVSVHMNQADNKSAVGTEVYYYPHANDRAIGLGSGALAATMLKNIIGETGAHDRGTKEYDYDVLSLTTVPAVLCEMGFVSNITEAASLSDTNYRDKLARSLYKGILAAFETYTPTR